MLRLSCSKLLRSFYKNTTLNTFVYCSFKSKRQKEKIYHLDNIYIYIYHWNQLTFLKIVHKNYLLLLIKIRSIYGEVCNWNSNSDNVQLRPHPKINRIATCLSRYLCYTIMCTMHVSNRSMQVITSLDYPSPNRTKVDTELRHCPFDYLCGKTSNQWDT